ncbi:MAG: tyrosine-type recombinase/integrase [Lachnospiraceae bacterium]|nr:tyrosine-type recombinase/integrase [Lachnospiraceae bacterium]
MGRQKGHFITEQILENYAKHLARDEKSRMTIRKYICDIKKLIEYADGRVVTKELVVSYKESLRTSQKYKLSSINSFLVAANRLFEYLGWYGMRVKTYRIQKEVFMPAGKDLSKAEYKRMVQAALKKGNKRLAMIIQTLCSLGIRASELSGITAESARNGTAEVFCKGKQRKILIPRKLQKLLLKYIDENNIVSGIIFRTSTGKAVDRSNMWREIKALGTESGVPEGKIFPHNFRHLFAKIFYQKNKDIAKLADILGHSSIETTRGYIKTNSDEYQKQIDLMGLV